MGGDESKWEVMNPNDPLRALRSFASLREPAFRFCRTSKYCSRKNAKVRKARKGITDSQRQKLALRVLSGFAISLHLSWRFRKCVHVPAFYF